MAGTEAIPAVADIQQAAPGELCSTLLPAVVITSKCQVQCKASLAAKQAKDYLNKYVHTLLPAMVVTSDVSGFLTRVCS